jgi:hypothetical protein
MRYFYKIIYGYASNEFVSVEAGGDLERAIYAWVEKIPVMLDGKMIEGRTILRIEPHIQKYTGWNENYKWGDAEDMEQIKRDVPRDIEHVLYVHQQHVAMLQGKNSLQEIGAGGAMELLANSTQHALRGSNGMQKI